MKISFVAWVLMIFVLFGVAGTIGNWIAVRLAGVHVTKVTFFSGPRMFSFIDGAIVIGWIPYGGSVAYDVPQFRQLPVFVRLATTFASGVVLAAIAITLLGRIPAREQFTFGFVQVLFGSFHPQTMAQVLLARTEAAFHASSMTAVGILAAKYLAFSLFPIGGWIPLHAFQQLFAAEEEHGSSLFVMLSMLAGMVVQLSWLWALLFYAFKGG